MIIRFSAFHQAFRDGELPVRLLGRLNQEFGYPVANFLYPGFMYLAEPFHIIGFNFVDSIKIVLGLSLLLSGVFTYFWLRKFFNKFPSAIGALFYIYTPYHLYDVYKRGSVGEVLALAIVPFILWQIERKSILFASLGIGLLLLAHNTLAILFLLLILCYMLLEILLSKNRRQPVYQYTSILVIGFGLSAFFWLPALLELRYTVFSQTTIAHWGEYFSSVPLLGYSTLFVVVATVVAFLFKKINIKKHRLTLLLFVFCIISLFLSSALSSLVWNILPVDFVQFPFRFLSVTILCSAFLAACLTSLLKGTKQYVLGFIFIIVLIISAAQFIKTSQSFDRGEGYYATNMATTTVQDEYMPVWVKEKPLQRAEKKVEIIKGKGVVQNISYTNKKVSFTANIEKSALVRVNMIYWPGWEAFVDNKPVSISYNNPTGLIEFLLSEGKHEVQIRFGETPLRMLADAVSGVSLLTLLIWSVIKRKR